jgi:hypothetical protein
VSVRPALVVAAAVVATVAVAAPPATGAKGATRMVRGHWPMNEVKGSTVKDTSGHHHDGKSFHVTRNGSAYTFNGRNSRVIVPNAGILNPKNRAFSLHVKLKMDTPPMPVGETYDVLRKGLVSSAGGDYKLEIQNRNGEANAHCVVRTVRKDGTRLPTASVFGTTDLADNKFHVITCSKTSKGLTLKVDSMAPVTRLFTLGSVSNPADLGLGAKAEMTATTGFDWFDGVMADAFIATP